MSLVSKCDRHGPYVASVCPACQTETETFFDLIEVDAVADILQERGKRYGEFAGHAEITQALKRMICDALERRGKRLADDQLEALDMIAHKIGRIVNGDPDYADSWDDIAGYARLVGDRLRGANKVAR